MVRLVGRLRTGTSCASSNRPSGAIQIPRNGRMLRRPPTKRRAPTGSRTHREDGRLSHPSGRAPQAGSLCSKRLSWRSSLAVSRLINAAGTFASRQAHYVGPEPRPWRPRLSARTLAFVHCGPLALHGRVLVTTSAVLGRGPGPRKPRVLLSWTESGANHRLWPTRMDKVVQRLAFLRVRVVLPRPEDAQHGDVTRCRVVSSVRRHRVDDAVPLDVTPAQASVLVERPAAQALSEVLDGSGQRSQTPGRPRARIRLRQPSTCRSKVAHSRGRDDELPLGQGGAV